MVAVTPISVPKLVERPSCPECGAGMRLVWIAPERTHVDRHILQCRSCEQTIEVIVERDLD